MMKKIVVILFFLILLINSYSQDLNLSLFTQSPVLLNPANSGNFDGKYRFYTNYRHQGDFSLNPYSSNIIVFDKPVFYFKQLAGIAFSLVSDRQNNSSFNTNEFHITASHFLKISKTSYLHMGFDFAIVNKIIDPNNLTFPDQFDNSIGIFNSTIDNQEKFLRNSVWFPDLAWGFIWTYNKEKFQSQLGISMFHYNFPQANYLIYKYNIKPRYQIHFFCQKNFGNFTLIPKFIFTLQNASNLFIIGSSLRYTTKNKTFQLISAGIFLRGGFMRNQDGAVFTFGFEYNNWNINFAYDFSTIDSPAQSNILELSLSFILPHLTIDKRSIQCEIF